MSYKESKWDKDKIWFSVHKLKSNNFYFVDGFYRILLENVPPVKEEWKKNTQLTRKEKNSAHCKRGCIHFKTHALFVSEIIIIYLVLVVFLNTLKFKIIDFFIQISILNITFSVEKFSTLVLFSVLFHIKNIAVPPLRFWYFFIIAYFMPCACSTNNAFATRSM